MNVAAAVVMKRVGSRIMRATPTQNTVNRRAPRTATRRAATRAKTNTVRVITKNRPRGMPERAIWERRKDCRGSVSKI